MNTIRFLALAASAGLATTLTSQAQYTLQILHASDLEGGLDALNRAANFGAIVEDLEGTVANTVILSAGDNYIPGPFFNAAGDRATFRDSGLFNATYNDLFGLPGGLGDQYGGLREEGGRVDISIMNVIGFDASAVGNHEFDNGSDAFEQIIEEDFRGPGLGDDRWVGAQFPYLSANLDFSGDGDLGNLFTASILPSSDFATGPNESLAGLSSTPKIAAATTINVNGEIIGVVGATTQILEQISSPGGTVEASGGDNDMAALAAVLQPVINDVAALGVDKIILVSHLQQIAFEQELATLLSGVDVIIAGGSDTLLANAGELNPGDTADAAYPLLETSAAGEPVAIVSTAGEYSYVGRLVVEFDALGRVIPASIDPLVSGPIGTELTSVDYDVLKASTTKDDAIQALVDAVQSVITAKDGNIAGASKFFVDGRRASVRTGETVMGDITADANLAVAKSYDPTAEVSLKNGGGIRAPFGEIDSEGNLVTTQPNPLSGKQEGEISQLDIENTLRFNNQLWLMTVTAQELKDLLEHGVAASGGGSTPGQYPQVGGLRFSFDETAQPAIFAENPVDVLEVVQPGQRINSIALTDEAGNTTEQLLQDGEWIADPNRPVRLVTLNFLAGAFTSSNVIGGDGYPFPAFGENIVELPNVLSDPGVFDFSNPGGEQDALAEYLWANFPPSAPLCQPETPVTLDTRIQQLLFRSDTVNFPPVSTGGKTLTKIGNFDTGIFDEAAAEIATFDADSQRIFFTNADAATVTILDASDPTNLSQVGEININRIFGFTWRGWTISANPNSVDVHDGLVAVAVNCEITTPNDKTYPTRGLVAFFNVYGHYVGKSWAGYGPDNLAFSPDGRKVVVANEGEPTDDYSFDPRGSVTVTSVTKKRRGYRFRTREASFRKFDKDELVDEGLRIFGPGASAAQDIEPEFVCISEDSRTAWVTLQENNGVAEVSLNRARITGITPLGTIDYMLESELDPSDRDDTINISTWPIQGFFHPDAIACYEKDGNTYLVTANEGDARDYDGFSEEERIKDIDLDPTAFPNAALLQEDEVLGRLNITTADGDTDGDGDFDELYAYGTRSFTIWCRDPQGNITRVYDSGAEFEKITATLIPTEFNSNNDENNSFESRSDNKGPEPEGVAVGEVDGRICAFIGLERVGGVMVYDVTNPEAPEFVEYITARDFSGDAEAGTAGDLGPEGLTFVSAEDSPTGKPLLIVANEVSGNVSVFEID